MSSESRAAVIPQHERECVLAVEEVEAELGGAALNKYDEWGKRNLHE